MKGIIFDFDGTLIDSRELADHALRKAWSGFFGGKECPDISDLPLFDTKRIISIILDKESLSLTDTEKKRFTALYSDFLNEFEAGYNLDSSIRDMLDSLKDNQNCITAIISNRREDSLDHLLAVYGIRQNFDYIYGRDTRKPKPDISSVDDFKVHTGIKNEDIVYVGDQDKDYDFARRAGISYYHAGYSSEPANEAWKQADLVLESKKQLRDLFCNVVDEQPVIKSPNSIIIYLKKNGFSLFAGAGISIPSGYGTWDASYKAVFERIGISHLYDDESLIERLQLISFHEDYNHQLFHEFKEYFSPRNDSEPCYYHFILINILLSMTKRIWTTNYDQLFEKIIIDNHLDLAVVKKDDDLQIRMTDKCIIKMNGDFESAQFNENLNWNVIFLKEQFDLYEHYNPQITKLFIEDYTTSSIVFVGYSLNDPSLQRIISQIKHKNLKAGYYHYLCTVLSKDLKERMLQQLREKELRQYGILIAYFKDYSEIADFLKKLAVSTKKINVGISGAIPDSYPEDSYYENSLFTVKETADICGWIGRNLSAKGCKVASGGAPFVGIPAVESAFDVNEENAVFFFRKHGGTFFRCNAPAIISKSTNLSDMRREFISNIDILIVIAGRIVDSDRAGVSEEIEYALQRSIPVLIFKNFGGQGCNYYEKFINTLDKYYKSDIIKDKVFELNKKINNMNKAETEIYIKTRLSDDIKETLTICFSHQINRPGKHSI